jgi:hypothetical protein
MPWLKKSRKFRSKTILKIDARLHEIKHQKSRKLTQKQKMLKMYNPNGEQRSANFFIPSLPVKRHPQLEKIETYFVSIFLNHGLLFVENFPFFNKKNFEKIDLKIG